MKFITCGVTWGSNKYNFKEISKKLNVAILAKQNIGTTTFNKVNIGTDYIALKHGFQTFALGKSVNRKEGTWADLKKLKSYEQLSPSEKDFIEKFDDEITYINVDKWIEVDIDYALRQSTVQIRNPEVYGECCEIIDKYIEEKTMQKYIILLEQQKNIVLTGAPGTGKTYLAKGIAEIITNIPPKDYDDMLLEKINSFTKEDKNKILNDAKLLLAEFTKKYPKEQLNSLTLEQYCIGTGTNDSLSYWLERKLQPLGRFRPGFSSLGHFIYFDKLTQNYIVDTKRSKISAEELMPQVAQTIYQLIATKSIENLLITNLYQNQLLKLLHSYYPSEYFPVFGATQLKNICISLGIKSTRNLIENNKKILDYFQKNDKFKNIDPILIMYGIYKDNVNLEEDIIEKENSAFVQFHPSYDYTDFVEGLRPVYKENKEIGFELKDGIFKSFCRQATESPNNKFVFIIDEINRAELSKVFGELFYSLEPGYRGEEEKVQLQYSNLYSNSENDDPFKGGFYVPKNVYIIATMNDIDRSIEPFDFAMKRRFAWCEVKPTETCDNMWVGQDGTPYPWATEAKNRMTELNNLIRKEFSSAYEIGGAYFLKLNALNGNFDLLWEYHIAPVIKDYLKGYNDLENELYKFKQTYDLNTSQTNNEMSNE